jgi:nondiscriminating glutamyl-tRNA synthetase
MRLRFAPSPTGHLHVGNARTALFNWLLARGQGGSFILRIENSDALRSTRESEAAILEDLRWLGLDWDEGPDVGGARGPYRQSERHQLYASFAQKLLAADRAYYCFCPPVQVEDERAAGGEEGHTARSVCPCRSLSKKEIQARIDSGDRPAIRFRVPESRDVVFQDIVRGSVRFPIQVIGDPIIVRSNGTAAYNFAVVVDDALMEVTHVIRGEDHISNTPRQILLYEALGFTPPIFAHLALVTGADHSPLSKRHGATSVAEFRAKGYLPEALVNYLALIGWSPRGAAADGSSGDASELLTIQELARRFSLDRIGHSSGVFDEEKLAWVNRHYLKEANPSRIAELSIPYFREAGVDMNPAERGLAFLASIMAIATSSVDRLAQIPDRLSTVFRYEPEKGLADPRVREEVGAEGSRRVVRALAEELERSPRLDRERFRAVAAEVKSRSGQKGKQLFHPIRIALTGLTDGPELDLVVPAIDQGADLPRDAGVPPILGCRERAAAFVQTVERL